MLENIHSKFRKKTGYNSSLSDFIRTASSGEKKKVFERVIKDSIEDQRKLMERADRELAERAVDNAQPS